MALPPDPSNSVSPELLPHVHLVSSYRYPSVARPDPNEIAKWLMSAPGIARDQAPFFWTYLDKPSDGTIYLAWQPLRRMNVAFATDGYVWAPPETLYKHDLQNGLILEIYYTKAGYGPGEQSAVHARRRFRLVPAPGHPNPPQIDINLFLVHWGPSEPADRIPSSVVPVDDRTNGLMHQRQYLMRAGQIRQKEFMLSDRVNWPTLPEINRQQMGPQMNPRGTPQQMAYPTQQPVAGPPAKRARHAQNQGPAQGPMPGHGSGGEPAFDDDEDVSRGDMFDHLTPREISLARYQQNHEWMEEILSSPYRIHQITPADLNLGLKGELASLTDGIFTAQGSEAIHQVPEKPYVGTLDEGQAERFRQRVAEHIKTTKDEIEKMQADHAAALAAFKKESLVGQKEKELRGLVDGVGAEVWRVEGSRAADEKVPGSSTKTPEEIMAEVEAAVGCKIASKPAVERIQDGGYQPPAPEPVPEPAAAGAANMSRGPSQAGSQGSGLLVGDSDVDMGNTAAGLLDQMHTGLSSTSTPMNNFPTPQGNQSATQSAAATPSNAQDTATPARAANAPTGAQQPAGGDVSMGGTAPADKEHAGTAPDQGTGSGDWVVVPKGGASPAAAAGAPAESGSDQSAAPAPKATSTAATPAVTESGSAGFDNNDFSSLGDLDTAGDALAGYDGSGAELGDGLDLQMDMDDSAFGEAFEGAGAGGASAGTPGQGDEA